MKQIIFLKPVFTHNIWGGTRLRDQFGYAVEGEDIGECWGIAAHENGDCVVREGEFQGKTLSQLWKERPDLFGFPSAKRFPLLVKLIDAKEDLSIQVHPNDSYAFWHENGSLGKTECWYILDCAENASLVIGHNAESREELEELIREGNWPQFLREIRVQRGDFIQIAPGTVHAIKSGMLLLEIQQNSDVTYRVYDYNRLSDGKPRELHLKQSMDVITVPAKPAEECVIRTDIAVENVMHEVIACDYYTVYKLDVAGRMRFVQDKPFLLMSVVEGGGRIDTWPVKKGDHFILPSDYGEAEIEGNLQLIAAAACDGKRWQA